MSLSILKAIFIIYPLPSICRQFKEKQNLELTLFDFVFYTLRRWLFIYTNCFPTVPSNAKWHFEHICTYIRQISFSSHNWETGNLPRYVWPYHR